MLLRFFAFSEASWYQSLLLRIEQDQGIEDQVHTHLDPALFLADNCDSMMLH